ncbi:MAG: DUF4831 family protein [Prevotellaceae bacterium]|jgi:hypothetical protein|nr:DUF4831 family protein [Prevotellaceae bacterium]
MKKTVILFCAIALSCNIFSAEKTPKATAPMLSYSLPRTALLIEITTVKTEQKAGPYYKYAERYLALKDVITEDKTVWEISSVRVKTRGIADPNRSFMLKNATNLSLTNTGVIRGINLPETDKPNAKKEHNKQPKINKAASDDFYASPFISEEQLMANSVAKMAEIAAKQIFRLRDSRISLISGENEKMPADGESLKLMLRQMDKMEESLTELFAGKKITTTVVKTVEIVPNKNLKNEMLFNFSETAGISDKPEPGSYPVQINLSKQINATPAVNAKSNEGLFYLLPGAAEVELWGNNTQLFKGSFDMAQFGTLQQLPASKGDLKVRINTKTGALISVEK